MLNSNSNNVSSKTKYSTSKRLIKKQHPYGIALSLIIIVFGIYLSTISVKLGLFWVFGCCFGFILQKSRFCFTASIRDPYLTGNTSLARAVLIAFAITTIGFTAIKYGYYINGLPIPGQAAVVPIGLATVVGALIFGIGMVIAGGCACGTLMRAGEGFSMQALALFFFIIGSLWGAHDFAWWEFNFMFNAPKVFLPDIFGWFGGLTIQLLFIGLLYIIAIKWENKKQQED